MDYEVETATLPPSEAAAIRTVIPMAELPQFFGEAFHELTSAVTAAGASTAGPPFARYFSVGPGSVDVEAVMQTDKPVVAVGRVRPIHLDQTRAAIVRYVGPYDAMKPAYDAISDWMSEHGKHPAEAPREVYLTSPTEVPDPAKWVTLVEQPIH